MAIDRYVTANERKFEKIRSCLTGSPFLRYVRCRETLTHENLMDINDLFDGIAEAFRQYKSEMATEKGIEQDFPKRE